jgi:hypothetical protein
MKTQYNIKEPVWIHMGERNLVPGRVVEIIDLDHLNEKHSPDLELYVIEIKTGIDDIYEVRTFEQISSDAKGPINLFRKHKNEIATAKRYLKKVGIVVPVDEPTHLADIVNEINEELAGHPDDPTPEEIHAAIDRATELAKHDPLPSGKRPAKKKYFRKKTSKV